MSFLDKLKSGVAEAGNKAKIAVEVNRLKLQNSSKQKEIEKNYEQIGKQVFLSVAGRAPSFQQEEVSPLVNRILELEQEIQANLQQISVISNEQQCKCGQVVPLNTKFCPSCGHAMNEQG